MLLADNLVGFFFGGGGGFEHFFTQEICTFLKSTRNCAFLIQLGDTFKEFFSTLIRGDATFLGG
jgi:hypothetical protein